MQTSTIQQHDTKHADYNMNPEKLVMQIRSQQHTEIQPNHGSLDAVQTYAILACLLYSLCSMMMTFTNKMVLSVYDFRYPMFLLVYQHVFSVIFVQAAKFMGFITVEPLKWSVVQKWLPVNVLFVAMLLSGSYTLKFLSVPMVTIFKNFTTIMITMGDYLLFKHPLSMGIMFSLSLMLFGSIVAALNDLEFTALGYLWMIVNCVVSAAYVLYIRAAMKGTKLSEFGNVYYNNALSIPLLVPLMLINGLEGLSDFPYWSDPGFIMVAFFTGLSSVGISFASFWTVKTTSPTTYSVVGSLNKIPLTILGVLVFATRLNALGTISIIIGLTGGVVYSWVKHMEWSSSNRK